MIRGVILWNTGLLYTHTQTNGSVSKFMKNFIFTKVLPVSVRLRGIVDVPLKCIIERRTGDICKLKLISRNAQVY